MLNLAGRIAIALHLLGFFVSESGELMARQGETTIKLPSNESDVVHGDSVIQNTFRNSFIKIRTTNRLAGAIDSIQWNGKEFIDSYDHGRQLQSASSFDAGQASPFWSERFNPTEAGSSRDGTGEHSTSKLLEMEVSPNRLRTKIEAAFWLAPGEASGGFPAINKTERSAHTISKELCIGVEHDGQVLPNVIDYRVTFDIPRGESHKYAQFEALTGYMPPEFSEFWGFDIRSHELVRLDDGPGEQAMPIVFSTQAGDFAMGCVNAKLDHKDYQGPGYGRFRFLDENVVKWNIVFRLASTSGVRTGEHSFRMFVPIGTREDVRLAIQHLLVGGKR